MARKLPRWCKDAKKRLIDLDMNVTELSKQVGFNRAYVSQVVNGRVYAPEIASQIASILGIDSDYISIT